jgi:hypothetical protein
LARRVEPPCPMARRVGMGPRAKPDRSAALVGVEADLEVLKLSDDPRDEIACSLPA